MHAQTHRLARGGTGAFGGAWRDPRAARRLARLQEFALAQSSAARRRRRLFPRDRVDARDAAAAMGPRRQSLPRRQSGWSGSADVLQPRAHGAPTDVIGSLFGSTRYLMKPPGPGPIAVSATLAGGAALAAAGEVRNVATTCAGHGAKRQLPSDFGSRWRVSTI